MIFEATRYYISQRGSEKAALSAYYSGRIRQSQKKSEEALNAFLEAEYYAEETDNPNLKGLIQRSIGKVYYEQHLIEEAIPRLRQANRYLHEAKNHEYEILSLNLTGNCFLIQGKQDSAFACYRKGLALVDQYGRPEDRVMVRQNIGVAYRQAGDLKNSLDNFRVSYGAGARDNGGIKVAHAWVVDGYAIARKGTVNGDNGTNDLVNRYDMYLHCNMGYGTYNQSGWFLVGNDWSISFELYPGPNSRNYNTNLRTMLDARPK